MTLPDSLADVEIETPGESAGQRYAAALLNSFAYKLRKVDVETLNDPVAEVRYSNWWSPSDKPAQMKVDERGNTQEKVEA